MNISVPTPLALIAELTHRCPLHCVYCSNPLELDARANELTTDQWVKIFRDAAELGVLQADFTGGEPLARPDILELVAAARAAGLYVNLITSGLPLDEARLAKLVAAGLDHFQLSFQGARPEIASEISGTTTHAQKLRVLGWLRNHRVAVTLNFVTGSFDFVWSWGVIHHSSRTGSVVREIARVSRPNTECRIMVYSRTSAWVYSIFVRDYLLGRQFLKRSFEETLYYSSDGFMARFYVREQFEDLFRTFFEDVSSELMGQESDVVPLPRTPRKLVMKLLPESYQRSAQARRGSFIFLTARGLVRI